MRDYAYTQMKCIECSQKLEWNNVQAITTEDVFARLVDCLPSVKNFVFALPHLYQISTLWAADRIRNPTHANLLQIYATLVKEGDAVDGGVPLVFEPEV